MVHEAEKYRVKRGDSLWRIAHHELGHGAYWPQIAKANNLRPNAPLLIGQFLTVPRGVHQAIKPPLPASPHPAPPQNTQRPLSPAPPKSSPVPPAGSIAEQATRLARPVLFPKFQYKFERTVLTIPVAGGYIECKVTGDLSVQQQGVITGGVTFNQHGVEVEYKTPADGAVKSFFSSCTASIDGNQAKLTLATGSVFRMGNRELATTQVELGPEGPEYVYKGEEVKFAYKGFDFAGQIGYRMSFHPDSDGGADRSREPARAPSTSWRKTLAVTLIVGAAVVIVADAFKDVGTAGVGAAETPLSWAAAARMFASGVGMWRMATP